MAQCPFVVILQCKLVLCNSKIAKVLGLVR